MKYPGAALRRVALTTRQRALAEFQQDGRQSYDPNARDAIHVIRSGTRTASSYAPGPSLETRRLPDERFRSDPGLCLRRGLRSIFLDHTGRLGCRQLLRSLHDRKDPGELRLDVHHRQPVPQGDQCRQRAGLLGTINQVKAMRFPYYPHSAGKTPEFHLCLRVLQYLQHTNGASRVYVRLSTLSDHPVHTPRLSKTDTSMKKIFWVLLLFMTTLSTSAQHKKAKATETAIIPDTVVRRPDQGHLQGVRRLTL